MTSVAALPRPPALSIEGLVKTFGAQRALDSVDFSLGAGEVHGLVGQNGSGKSTLIKLLSGYHQPDEVDSCTLNGNPFPLGSGAAAHHADIRFVHQDLALVGTLDAVENFALAAPYKTARGVINWRRERARVRAVIRRLGYDFDVTVPVAQLAASERVGLAIARALEIEGGRLPSILVFDEPTAALPAPEVAQLFRAVEAVRAQGVAVIYVSHRLEEVLMICDRVTVLRDGKAVAVRSTQGLDTDGLVGLMLGSAASTTAERTARSLGEPLLELNSLTGQQVVGLDLTIHSGEIVGVAGVTGSGRDELAGLVAGAVKSAAGQVCLDGVPVERGSTTATIRAGIAYLPSDRLTKALIPSMNVRENMTLLNFGAFGGERIIRPSAERCDAGAWLERLDVRPRRTDAGVLQLSGGNQQKVVLARLLRLPPHALVLDEPTQGVDVGASGAIHELIRGLARGGACSLVCSTDTEELVALCDRVVVLREGRIVASFDHSELTVDALDRAVLGAQAADVFREADIHDRDATPTSEVQAP